MITFIAFVLFKLNAPWWVYLLSIIGVILELDSSELVHRGDKIDFNTNEFKKGD